MTFEEFIRSQPANARIGACLKRYDEHLTQERVRRELRQEADRLRMEREIEREIDAALAIDPTFCSHAGLHARAA